MRLTWRPDIWLLSWIAVVSLGPSSRAVGENLAPIVRPMESEAPASPLPSEDCPPDAKRPFDFPKSAIPAPPGSYVRQWQHAMVGQTRKMDLLISRHFWYQGGSQLGPEAEQHVARMASWLLEHPEYVVLEAEEVRIDYDQSLAEARAETLRLNELRRQVVVAELTRRGVPDADHWVVVQPVDRVGARGLESPLIYMRLLMGGRGGRGMGGGGMGGRHGGRWLLLMNGYRERVTWSVFLLLVSSLAGCASVVTRPDTPLPEPLAPVTEQSKAEACRRTAEELANHGREPQAIEQFERARRHDPRIRGVAHRLAVLLDRQGKMDAADRKYRLALEESPRNPDVLNDYGFFQYELGNLDQAADLLRRALKHDGQHARALVNLGVVLAEQRKYDESWEAFSKGVGLAAAHHNLGMIHARHGDIHRARHHLEEALRRDPGLTPAAAVLEQLGRYDETSPIEESAEDRAVVLPGTSRRLDPVQ